MLPDDVKGENVNQFGRAINVTVEALTALEFGRVHDRVVAHLARQCPKVLEMLPEHPRLDALGPHRNRDQISALSDEKRRVPRVARSRCKSHAAARRVRLRAAYRFARLINDQKAASVEEGDAHIFVYITGDEIGFPMRATRVKH